MSKPVKHFTQGTVRGRVVSLKDRTTKAGLKPFGDMKIFCSSGEHGDVTVRCRFWGAQYPAFKKAFKDVPEAQFKLQGDIGIMESRGEKLICFNIYKFKLWVPTEKDSSRTSFILIATCVANFGTFEVNYVKQDPNYPVDDRFIFPSPDFDTDAEVGDIVKVMGNIVDPDAEFGSMGLMEPKLKLIEVMKRGEH